MCVYVCVFVEVKSSHLQLSEARHRRVIAEESGIISVFPLNPWAGPLFYTHRLTQETGLLSKQNNRQIRMMFILNHEGEK